METEENHHTCKRSRVGNGSGPVHQDEDEEDGEGKGGGGGRGRGGLRHWHHHSSRIFRVSRASGGKDRHSKVYTAKGLRDRRVRLSVSTAIQFYDLQDRLGYDQPSKAIEWLINSAAAAIAELPMLESSFLDPPKLHLLQAKPEIEYEAEPGNGSQQQHCSSASETSKGSVFYLPRSDSRVKARERARERAAKDKEKDNVSHVAAPQSLNSQSSFTELLTGSGSLGTATTAAQVNPSSNCIQKQIRYLPVAATADYFAQAGLFGQAQKAHQQPFGFTSQTHVGNSSPMGMLPFNIAVAAAAAAAATADHPEMQQFSFLQDHPVPVPAAVAGGDYNLNFSISSCLAGFNRGTLQSNSPSQLPHHHHHHHHLQRVSSPVDGSNLPFFFGAAPSAAAATSAEDHFPAGLDGRLQLYYDDEHRHSDLKGKGKS